MPMINNVKRVIAASMTMALLSFSANAMADLTPQLVKGAAHLAKVGFVPFDDEASQIVERDLTMSGRVDLVPAAASQSVDDVAQLDLKKWQQQGVQYLLFASGSQGDYQAQLIELSNKGPSVVFNQSFSGSTTHLAHQIANRVYQALTQHPGYFNDKVVFVSAVRSVGEAPSFTLKTADMDGLNEQSWLQSNFPILSPSLSGNGDKVVYVRFYQGQYQLCLLNLVNQQTKMLLQSAQLLDAPIFVADNKKLVFAWAKTGITHLYLMNVATKAVTPLTKGWSIDTAPRPILGDNGFTFTSNRGGSPQVYRYQLASGDIQRLSFSGHYNAEGTLMTNQQLVMLAQHWRSFGVAVQSADNSVKTLDQSLNVQSPSVLPQGQLVLYKERYANRDVLAATSLDGAVKWRLIPDQGDVEQPRGGV